MKLKLTIYKNHTFILLFFNKFLDYNLKYSNKISLLNK